MKNEQLWFVYVLRCADNTLYTGITTDTARRVQEHNAGAPLGARYTRSRRPVTLVHMESVASRALATRREQAIKKLDRRRKLELCAVHGLHFEYA
jgi:putative endonuclease